VKKFGNTEQRLLEKWKNECLDVSKLEALDPDKLSPEQIEREFQAFSQAVASKQKQLLINMGAKNNKSDDAETYYGLGLAYAKSEDYEKAIESFKQVIRINPDYAEVHCLLGLVYAESGDYEKAIEAYKQAIHIKYDDAEVHNVLGYAYVKSGNYEKAIEAYKEAIRINPNLAAAHNILGYAYIAVSDRSSALEEYKILKDLDKELANKLFDRINEPINKNTESADITETPSYSAYNDKIILACPNTDCKQKLRIPNIAGSLQITCPKCKSSFSYPAKCEPPPYSSCAYLDIETTGFRPSNGDITVIGIYLEKGGRKEFVSLIDNDINPIRLGEIFKGIDLIYTYNGSTFDLPFIQAKLGLDITRCCKHIDLMKECHERGIYGGLKETERKFGITRKWDVHGREAVALWYKYKYEGNKEALNTLLEYNKEDVVNLSQIKRKLAEMRPNAEIPKHQKDYSPTKCVDESKRSYDTVITTPKHTRVASSPQKELQQDVKPEMWHEEHPVADTVGCLLIVILVFVVVCVIAALLK